MLDYGPINRTVQTRFGQQAISVHAMVLGFPAEIREAKRREPRMNIFRLRSCSVLARLRGPIGMDIGTGKSGTGLSPVCRTVLLGRIIDTLTGA